MSNYYRVTRSLIGKLQGGEKILVEIIQPVKRLQVVRKSLTYMKP